MSARIRMRASAAQPFGPSIERSRLALACGLTATALGAAAALHPESAGALAGLVVLAALVGLRPRWSVAAAVIAAVFSRLLTADGLAPQTLNFAHFPLALVAAAASLRLRRATDAPAPWLGRGLLALAGLCVVSGLLNEVEMLQPALAWLLWSEPLLLVFALTRSGLGARARRGLWTLLLFCAWLQLPFGLLQAFEHGLGDVVQGTFVALGAGAHVAGSLALLGSLALTAGAARASRIEERYLRLAGAALLFLPSILGDAKTSIFFFIPALGWTIWRASSFTLRRLAAPVLACATLLVLGFALYAPLQLIARWETVEVGLAAKARGVAALLDYALDAPLGGALGLGPGESVSRVGVLSVPGETTADSPVRRLGLGSAYVADQLLAANRRDPIASASSVWSYISSWSGLAGDLGPGGAAIYAAMWLGLLGALARRRSWTADAAGGAIVMALLLGGAFAWLEEPGFILPVAMMAGVALAPERRLARPRPAAALHRAAQPAAEAT